jgi:hypothetical protein
VASVAVAAGVLGYAISAHDAVRPARRVNTTPRATLAAKVLSDAAAHVAREPLIAEPKPGQWIYTKTVYAAYQSSPTTDAEWVTFDGSHNAYYSGGQLIVHASDPHPPGPDVPPWTAWNESISQMTAYNVLASLPTSPQQLLAAIAAHMGKDGDNAVGPWAGAAPTTQAQAEFDYLSGILWNASAINSGPPAALAATYRAFASLPGVSVQTGTTDAIGAPAIGVSDDGGYTQLLLSPSSYQVIGLRSVSTGTNPALQQLQKHLRRIDKLPRARRAAAIKILRARTAGRRRTNIPWPPKGAVISSTALARAAEVAAPGDV